MPGSKTRHNAILEMSIKFDVVEMVVASNNRDLEAMPLELDGIDGVTLTSVLNENASPAEITL